MSWKERPYFRRQNVCGTRVNIAWKKVLLVWGTLLLFGIFFRSWHGRLTASKSVLKETSFGERDKKLALSAKQESSRQSHGGESRTDGSDGKGEELKFRAEQPSSLPNGGSKGGTGKELKAKDCSSSVSDEDIKELCNMYWKGTVTGDMCAPLCDLDQIHFTSCVHAKHFQKKVMMVQCTNVCEKGQTIPAILKTDATDVKASLREVLKRPQVKGRISQDALHNASRELIHLYVKKYIGFDPFEGKDAFKVVWGQGSEDDRQKKEYVSAVWRSLYLMMPTKERVQSEYVLSRVFAESRIFPEVYGSCGHFYLQESCPPSPNWVPWSPLQLAPANIPWSDRAQDAFKILELLDKLQNDLPQQLIGCDFKIGNLGYCGDGELKVIDSNSFFFKSSSAFNVSKKCHIDGEPCVLLGNRCIGTCDVQKQMCTMQNNVNLEYTCRTLFMVRTNMSKTSIASDGKGQLLRDPPPSVSADLWRVLHECASLSELYDREPGASQRILGELRTVLKRSLGFTR